MHRFVLLCLLVVAVPAHGSERVEMFGAAVELFSDRPDRAWVTLDRDFDGQPEEVIGLTAEWGFPAEILAQLPRSYDRARVRIESGRVTVFELGDPPGPDRALDRVVLALDGREGWPAGTIRDDARNLIRLGDGAALVRQRTGGAPDEVRDWVAGLEALERNGASPFGDREEECASGGPGSATCEAGCSFNIQLDADASLFGGGGAAGTSSGCSTECREGYYACCNCAPKTHPVGPMPLTVAKAECRCVKNS